MTRNQRIKDALKAAGKTQGDLAEALNITQGAVSERLNSDREIDSFELILAVSKLTGKDLFWIYSGDESGVITARDQLRNKNNEVNENPLSYLSAKMLANLVAEQEILKDKVRKLEEKIENKEERNLKKEAKSK